MDLGIQSIQKKSGLEIQTKKQFLLLSEGREYSFDQSATRALAYGPPDPFIVPPGESLRFELAFKIEGKPTTLKFRGYRSQGELKLAE